MLEKVGRAFSTAANAVLLAKNDIPGKVAQVSNSRLFMASKYSDWLGSIRWEQVVCAPSVSQIVPRAARKALFQEISGVNQNQFHPLSSRLAIRSDCEDSQR